MENLNDAELLKFALENGIIDRDTIRHRIEMNKRKEYLEKHNSKIWQSTDRKWYTFVPDVTKKDKRKLVKRKTRDELEDYLVDFYKKHTEPQTIEKTYTEWIARKVKFGEISNQTVDKYNYDFKRYFDDCKCIEIGYVTTDFLDNLIIENIRKYNLKAKAWSNLRTILKGTFLFAKKKGYTDLSIVTYLQELDLSRKIFNHDKKPDENTIYKESEIDVLLNEISDSKKMTDIAIVFAVYTGMRVGEILALKWEDLSEDYIHVNRSQIRYKNENGEFVYEIRDSPKTEAGIRDLVIVPQLRKQIKKLKSINPFTEFLFEVGDGVLKIGAVCSRLRYLCKKLNFPQKGMHGLRRYYATTLINAGVEEIIIISQMGHTDFSTTRKYYYKNNNEKGYTYKRVCDALSPISEKSMQKGITGITI